MPRAPLRRTKRDRTRLKRIRSQTMGTMASMGIERLESRAMLTFNYGMYNIVNYSNTYALVFEQGTEQGGQRLQPSAGSVIMPQGSPGGNSYGNAVFETYTIDIRSDPSDAGTSIGKASVTPAARSSRRARSSCTLPVAWARGRSISIPGLR